MDEGAAESRPKRRFDNASGQQPPPEPVAWTAPALLPAAAPVTAFEAEPVVPSAPGEVLSALAAHVG